MTRGSKIKQKAKKLESPPNFHFLKTRECKQEFPKLCELIKNEKHTENFSTSIDSYKNIVDIVNVIPLFLQFIGVSGIESISQYDNNTINIDFYFNFGSTPEECWRFYSDSECPYGSYWENSEIKYEDYLRIYNFVESFVGHFYKWYSEWLAIEVKKIAIFGLLNICFEKYKTELNLLPKTLNFLKEIEKKLMEHYIAGSCLEGKNEEKYFIMYDILEIQAIDFLKHLKETNESEYNNGAAKYLAHIFINIDILKLLSEKDRCEVRRLWEWDGIEFIISAHDMYWWPNDETDRKHLFKIANTYVNNAIKNFDKLTTYSADDGSDEDIEYNEDIEFDEDIEWDT
jgi:hypothetical protein